MSRIFYHIILLSVLLFCVKICLTSTAENSVCAPHDFTCTAGRVKCVSQEKVCDGIDNCEDRSDEHHCHKCGGPHNNWFYCGNNKDDCIAAHWRCDGEADCDDGSDEMNCSNTPTTQTSYECSENEFQCSNGMCIPIIWYCDGHHDCIDKSDEDIVKCKGINNKPPAPINSDDGKVGVSHWGLITHDSSICDNDSFTCKSGDCVPKRWVCDGTADCPSGDDEHNCPHSDQSCRNLTLKGEETYLCNDGFTCIKLTQMCDDKPDCPDGSDEGETCKTSCQNNGGCQQSCMPNPRSDKGTCFCHSGGYTLSDDQKTCNDVDECKIFGVCSQECQNLPGNYMCSCKEGYKDVDGTCKASKDQAVLYYSSRSEVRGLDLHTREPFLVSKEYVSQAIGVTYDSKTDRVYWSDVEPEGAIASSFSNGTDVKYFLQGSKVDMVESMAIDYVARNIYFTDSRKKIVSVCSLDFHLKKNHTSEINKNPICSTILINIDQPREIALYPPEGLLFYTNWGEKPHIGRVGMDGTRSEAIITEDIGWPNGITVDVVMKRIYWSDAKHGSIETAKFDGSDRRIVFKQTVQHPFSLSVFEDTLYWSDWQNQQIHSCSKFHGDDHQIITKENELHGIHVYHPLLEVNHPNPCLYSKCSHLCLLAYGGNDYTCACPSPKKWHLAEDRTTCHYHFDTESSTPITRDYVYNHAWVTSERGRSLSVNTSTQLSRKAIETGIEVLSGQPNALIDENSSSWPVEAKVILGAAIILFIIVIILLLFIAMKYGFIPCLSDFVWKKPELIPTGLKFNNPAFGLDSTDSSRSPSRSSTCSNRSESSRLSKNSLQKLSLPMWQNDNYTRLE